MVRHEELGLFGDMIADGEHGRFDLVRLAVEDTLGGCYRGVLPMVGDFAAGALPPKMSRSPVETARGNHISNEVRVIERFDASSSAVRRELDESNRFVQKSAESTSM